MIFAGGSIVARIVRIVSETDTRSVVVRRVMRSSSIYEEALLGDGPLLDHRDNQSVAFLPRFRRLLYGAIDGDTLNVELATLDHSLDQNVVFLHAGSNTQQIGDRLGFRDAKLFRENRNRSLGFIIGVLQGSADHLGETTGRWFLAYLAEALRRPCGIPLVGDRSGNHC